jgi:MFS family permease
VTAPSIELPPTLAGALSPGQRRRVLVVASACYMSITVAYFAITPVAPAIAQDLGLGADTLGLVLGINSIVAAMIMIPVGVLADRYGRRPFLVAGVVVVIFIIVSRAAATNVYWLAAGMVGVGIASPMLAAGGFAIVAEAYDGRRSRARALGFLQAAGNFGQLIGMLPTGLLAAAVGWRLATLALAVVPAVLLPFALTVPRPPGRPPAVSLAGELRKAIRFMARLRAVALVGIAAASVGTAVSATYLLPFVARGQGAGQAAIGVLLVPFLAGSVAGPALGGLLADRFGAARPLLVMLVLVSGSACFLIFDHSLSALVVPYLVIGGGTGAASVLIISMVVEQLDLAGEAGLGAGLGAVRLGQQMGPGLGPVLVGLAFTHAGVAGSFGALACPTALASLVAIRFAIARTRKATPQVS